MSKADNYDVIMMDIGLGDDSPEQPMIMIKPEKKANRLV